MAEYNADIVIVGAGIAGLWTMNALKARGFRVIVLESDAIGGGQSIASQGIIHSGLKYTLAGKVNTLAQSISRMPKLWRTALNGKGEIDLSTAQILSQSQSLLMPKSLIGAAVGAVASLAISNVRNVPAEDWPPALKQSGFEGSVTDMKEMVLDVPSVIEALAARYRTLIFKTDRDIGFEREETGRITSAVFGGRRIRARGFVFSGAASNAELAKLHGHDKGLKTQRRPLLMGMMRPAPFTLYAHLVGMSEKPVATITTHQARDGTRLWYLGAQVAEREKEAAPQDVYNACRIAFKKYMPQLDLSQMEFATLPIDRIEGASKNAGGWMPDTPTMHAVQNALYVWPTKLTFAPMLAQMIETALEKIDIRPDAPSEPAAPPANWPLAPIARPPWENAAWEKIVWQNPA